MKLLAFLGVEQFGNSRTCSNSLRWGPKAGGLGALAIGLSGCIQPLYTSVGGHLGSELQAVSLDPVPDRLGHYLRDQLMTNLNGTGSSVPAKYRLKLNSNEAVQTALIDTVSGRSQNASVVTTVTYTLFPIGSETPIAKGTVVSSAAYDRSEQRFANIRAARDAEIRDARTLADQITTRVASALANPQPIEPSDKESPKP